MPGECFITDDGQHYHGERPWDEISPESQDAIKAVLAAAKEEFTRLREEEKNKIEALEEGREELARMNAAADDFYNKLSR
jgi:TRAP-type C4-dicarboxylate transport system substrate-binding protein